MLTVPEPSDVTVANSGVCMVTQKSLLVSGHSVTIRRRGTDRTDASYSELSACAKLSPNALADALGYTVSLRVLSNIFAPFITVEVGVFIQVALDKFIEDVTSEYNMRLVTVKVLSNTVTLTDSPVGFAESART